MISVVCPVFNEEKVLAELCRRVSSELEKTGADFEIILVNDGSTDGSLAEIKRLIASDGRIKCVNFSRNFGQQPAVTAGMELAGGDAVILMDSDLQDDPAALPLFVTMWREGGEVVYAMRVKRKEGPLKRFAYRTFYRVMAFLGEQKIPLDSGLFCLMDRVVVDSMKLMPEHNRYLPGLRAWVGYRQIGVVVERAARYDRKARLRLSGLVRLALDGIFSFSTVPLRIATLMSMIVGFSSLAVIFFILFHKFITGDAIPGWASTFGSTLVLGALILFALGVIGEYLARIYDEVKKRPLYIVREIITKDNLK